MMGLGRVATAFGVLSVIAATASAKDRTGFAEVNGVKLYYEVRGAGAPVVLLHGGTSTIEHSFGKLIPPLAKHNLVIGIEQVGHGHSPDADRPYSYEQMADDTAAVLAQLKIERSDFIGWSDGGQVALELALRHPTLVRKLVISGADVKPRPKDLLAWATSAKPDDWPKDIRDAYAKVSPDGAAHFGVLLGKVTQLWSHMRRWTPAEIASVKMPILIVAGDREPFLSPEDAAAMAHAMPNASLAILPNTPHDTFAKRPEWLNPMILDFLAAPS